MNVQLENHTQREAFASDVDSESIDTELLATTNDGQPLAANEELATGSKSWGDVQKDKHQYELQGSFPSNSEARTTFYAREADNPTNDPAKFDRLFKYQHCRGHTFEGWEGQRVRPEDAFTYRRACVILSQADVTGMPREQALQRVMEKNLNGFSRYYEGVDGAALGFACLAQYNDQESAKDSRIAEVAEEKFDLNSEKLVEYVWRKYGGDAG